MPGITRYGSYVPYFRLTRAAIGGGQGERAVASYDEDSVSMAVEAARDALRDAPPVDAVMFATTSPPYAEKLNAAMLQAALGLPRNVRSLELGSSSRMGLAGLLVGADIAGGGGRALVCAADVVTGAPGGTRESQSGDAGVAFLTGDDDEAIARFVGCASATTEVLDVWRLPQDHFAKQWEERFGADILGPLINDTATRALKTSGIEPTELKTVIVDSTNARAAAGLPRALGLKPEQLADPLAANVGRSGAAHAGLLLARALDEASPGDRILVLSAGDGCDAAIFEVTERIASGRPPRSVDRWIAAKRDDLPYNTYLKWRGILPFEPPRRPDPDRPAAPPVARANAWKHAFIGSRCEACGTGHLPPQRVCVKCAAVDRMKPEAYANTACKIATYTLDHLAYSMQPPVVAAIVDFEGGGRLSCELTDVDPRDVEIGNELEMTFRRLYTGEGVHNYFWKARPRR
ncbi:MAG: OB-fold domain-containing protein [Myxococcota bacterium]